MFEAIETNLKLSAEHGRFVVLESYAFERGTLTVHLRSAGLDDGLKLRFSDVIGLTMSEDVFGSDGGQITRESLQDAPMANQPKGFFNRSTTSPTIQAIFDAVKAPFDDSVRDHQLFLLSLREHELSFVAHKEFEIEHMSQDMA
ncbi:hypothetical protein GFB49_00700 [Epibacterium sp. SM1979]|uniref:Uncharacterized protein n=1 Tax=Tritonibacter litoralis TaxID=2662264 RepID=A0A843YBW9_9RHOB|nr:hypothetical protein [Tritonibacter litoralis]MQQ06964.1 hypothetical protein [Tritonibacter litoralis]